MTGNVDKSSGVGRRGEPVMKNPHDMQIDKETGLPVAIVPDGEKEPTRDKAEPTDKLRIDPDSRIPRPVQPDLA
ncbi:hypothetical protein [Rhizobium sp.]